MLKNEVKQPEADSMDFAPYTGFSMVFSDRQLKKAIYNCAKIWEHPMRRHTFFHKCRLYLSNMYSDVLERKQNMLGTSCVLASAYCTLLID